VSQISLGFLGLSAIFCIFASFLLEKLGRRNTFVYGSLGHALLMITIGATYYLKSKGGLIASAMLFNLGISTAVMSTTATGYALAGEIPSVRLRSKTQSLGFGAYYILGWGLQFAVPYMFQVAPEGAGWGVRACWLFAGFTLLCSVFGFFYVGETQGRSFADIDELYHRGVSPRKFASTQVQAERDAVA
jgi:SP family general alpha glucoside:H+ symporter-like MFS transporter